MWKIDKDSESLSTLHYYTRTNESPRIQRGSEQLTFARVADIRICVHAVVLTRPKYTAMCVRRIQEPKKKSREKTTTKSLPNENAIKNLK